ncbi:hypothetical protein [Methanothrix sp.]|uniref:hypothetical protein n=1 Tax=Methanothrix sp. TaxID=90426 RepID=UPI00345E1362
MMQTLKADLQSCGTDSAKRHLKKLSGKEARFHRDVNHCISKKLVAKAIDTVYRLQGCHSWCARDLH